MNTLQTMASEPCESRRRCLEEFIALYKSEECLWRVKSKDYRNKLKKRAGYLKLVEKLSEIDPLANEKLVRRKIKSMRDYYKAELKKVYFSTKFGAEVVYEPKLWYYKLLGFLRSQEIGRISRRARINSHLAKKNCNVNPYEEKTEIKQPEQINAPNQTLSPQSDCKGPERNIPHDVLLNVNQHFKRPYIQEDRFDIFGRNVAAKLRDLPKIQRILAEKIINTALYEAEMDSLTPAHQLTVHYPLTPDSDQRFTGWTNLSTLPQSSQSNLNSSDENMIIDDKSVSFEEEANIVKKE